MVAGRERSMDTAAFCLVVKHIGSTIAQAAQAVNQATTVAKPIATVATVKSLGVLAAAALVSLRSVQRTREDDLLECGLTFEQARAHLYRQQATDLETYRHRVEKEP